MVVRRIHMNLDTWEELDRAAREASTGRKLDTGAPMHGTDEFDPVDLEARDSFGLKAIDPSSHVARAHPPKDHPEQKILRRPFNFNLAPSPDNPGELSNASTRFSSASRRIQPSNSSPSRPALMSRISSIHGLHTSAPPCITYLPEPQAGRTGANRCLRPRQGRLSRCNS